MEPKFLSVDRTAEPETLLTIPDVSAVWQVSPDTVRRAISRGDLKAVRVPGGRGIRIRPEDMRRALRPVTSLAGGGRVA